MGSPRLAADRVSTLHSSTATGRKAIKWAQDTVMLEGHFVKKTRGLGFRGLGGAGAE